MTDPAVFAQVRDVAERSIAEAQRLTGRALLEAAPTVRDLAYLLIKFDGIEAQRRRSEAKSAAAVRESDAAPAATSAPRRPGRPAAFSREDLLAALPADGSWRTSREVADALACARGTFLKSWTEYAATDERMQMELRGKMRVQCVRYVPPVLS